MNCLSAQHVTVGLSLYLLSLLVVSIEVNETNSCREHARTSDQVCECHDGTTGKRANCLLVVSTDRTSLLCIVS